MSQHPEWSARPARIFVFRSPHSSFLELSLSRHGSSWYLTYPRAYGMVDYTGQRIVARLNAPSPDIGERHRAFWYNSNWNGKGPANPLSILLESDPPAIRLTGRTRVEKRQGNSDEQEIECQEMEVIAPEEGLLRQCYYCLDWEQDNVPRFSKCGSGEDDFWCPSCQAKGVFIASSWGGARQALGYNTTRASWGATVDKDSLYA